MTCRGAPEGTGANPSTPVLGLAPNGPKKSVPPLPKPSAV
jgi:hypothetical protein